MNDWWRSRNWPVAGGWATGLLVVAAIIALAINSAWLIPVAILCGLLYLTYAGLRWFVLFVFPAPLVPASVTAATESVREIELGCREVLADRSWAARMSELSGSWLAAALVAATVAMIGVSLVGQTATTSLIAFGGHFLWLAVVIAAGAGVLLALGKQWEGESEGDAWVRRFLLLVAGLAVGALAFALAEFLFVSPIYQLDYLAGGTPSLAGHLLYFGALFAAIGWWQDVDPLRPNRFSLWSVVWSVLVAVGLNLLWPFPQPWGFLLAAGTCVSVQLASPWWNADDRFAAFASRVQ
jgi:hypothetical protein